SELRGRACKAIDLAREASASLVLGEVCDTVQSVQRRLQELELSVNLLLLFEQRRTRLRIGVGDSCIVRGVCGLQRRDLAFDARARRGNPLRLGLRGIVALA